MQHLDLALDAMQDAIDQARLRDSNIVRAYRRAIIFALWASRYESIGAQDDEHSEWLRSKLAELTAVFRIEELDRVPKEAVWSDIARIVEIERAHGAGGGPVDMTEQELVDAWTPPEAR